MRIHSGSTQMISKGADTDLWTDEEEQRDESSEREAHAMRIRPSELKEFYALDTIHALGSVCATWILIGIAIGLALWSRSVVVWIIAAIVVGRSQHALA